MIRHVLHGFERPAVMQKYRVLYASSQRLGCFVETLARFRIDPTLLAELAQIEGADDYCPLGEVPIEWVEKRIMGLATTDKEYADVCSSEWISRLRKLLAIHLKKFGVEEFDASVLQQTAPRILTHQCPGLFLMAALRESTTAQSTGTTLRTGLCSSPFKSKCRNPNSFDPMIGICSERLNFTR